jgi:hypothetical protein
VDWGDGGRLTARDAIKRPRRGRDSLNKRHGLRHVSEMELCSSPLPTHDWAPSHALCAGSGELRVSWSGRASARTLSVPNPRQLITPRGTYPSPELILDWGKQASWFVLYPTSSSPKLTHIYGLCDESYPPSTLLPQTQRSSK